MLTTLPNLLTLSRIAAIPLVIATFYMAPPTGPWLGCVIFSIAGLTDWLDGVILRDGRGFVLSGPDLQQPALRASGWPLERTPYHLETSVPGVFAAGDVRSESAKRVASAVGEGAMAVMLVHRYLEML